MGFFIRVLMPIHRMIRFVFSKAIQYDRALNFLAQPYRLTAGGRMRIRLVANNEWVGLRFKVK